MQSEATNSSTNYKRLIAALVKTLSEEKAAQLYSYARFLVADAPSPTVVAPVDDDDDIDSISDEALGIEDKVWSATLARHADKFAQLKDEGRAEVKAGKAVNAFDKNGGFVLK